MPLNILHDLHVHTNLSLCARDSATVENQVKKAKQCGLNKIGFADHFWGVPIGAEETWWEQVQMCARSYYTTQNFDHVMRSKSEIERLKGQGVELLLGCEAEYDPYRRDIAITEEQAQQFDFIIVPNSHTHMVMPKTFYEPYDKHIQFMIEAYEDILNSPLSRYVTAIAHPFEAVCCPYGIELLFALIPDDTYRRLFDKTAEKGIAVEINVASLQDKNDFQLALSPALRMYRLAKECGCQFTFGSDTHDAEHRNAYTTMDRVAALLELKEDDIAPIAR